MSPINAFTVDVEEYFQVSAFEKHIARSQWDQYESRVVASTQRILRQLNRHDVRATFFVLGWVADRYPQLVHEIYRSGHEIGSHSYWHRLIYDLSPEEFRDDLRRSRDVLENLIGAPVIAYRAPSFSITKRSLWALDILIEEGFRIDSSVFPIHHDRYGIPDAERSIHMLQTTAGQLWEFPPSVARFAGFNLPISGGGYFRLLPYAVLRKGVQQLNDERHSATIYVHPYEYSPNEFGAFDYPISWKVRLRQGLGRRGFPFKVDRMFSEFRFGAMRDVIQSIEDWPTHEYRLSDG
ncbi:MAG: DUF3473 domain-containing protein [Planctomycetes bacterium]|nr:DUF3473 domain-containing protein [Planctomycetota bacterium]